MEVTVLVCGFDKERVLYKGFDYFWKKYWPDCPWALRYMVNKIPFGHAVHCGRDPNWIAMMRGALNQIEAPIILFMLADYWLAKPVDTEAITQFASYMLPHDIGHIRLQRSDPVTQRAIGSFEPDPRLFVFGADAPYRISLQASLWQVGVFKNLLQYASSPWDFETNASVFASWLRCLCIDSEKTPNEWNHHAYLCYHNVVSMGQWNGRPIDDSRESDVDAFIERHG
jgi:hypothetical protein